MALRLYNTLTHSMEDFRPADPARVTFYTCGPTVYDFAHVGNFRSFLMADTLRRWLESPLCALVNDTEAVARRRRERALPAREVVHVMNLTDVGHMTDDESADGGGEDKMEAASRRLLEAKKSGALPAGAPADLDAGDPWAVASYYAGAFLEDARALGVRVALEAGEHPERLPRATAHVGAMLRLTAALLERGHAYVAGDGVVYFDTRSFPEYGRLSGNTLDRLRAGAGGRVEDANQARKRHPADFMLWKPDPTHRMRWEPSETLGAGTALREGYPGWHIECSAMAQEILGETIDLHSGGEDNIFPHHECEIAQSRCATGREVFARHWVHARHLMVEGEKMSKSRGNFYTARDLFARGFEPGAVRLELIRTHYRANANFTEQGLRDSARMIERWRRFMEEAGSSGRAGGGEAAAEAERSFSGSMDDDMNVAGAIGAINAWVNREDAPGASDAALLRLFDAALGVLSLGAAPRAGGRGGGPTDEEIDAMVRARDEARRARDFGEADRLRDALSALGVEVKDGPGGSTWSRRAAL